MKSDDSAFSWLMKLIGTQKKRVIASMTLAVIYSLLALVPYVLIYRLIDTFLHQPDAAASQVWWLVGLAVMALAGKIILQLFSGLLSHKAAFQLLFELRRKVIARVGDLPLGASNRHTSATMKKIISDDIGRIETFIAHHLPDIAAAIVSPLAAATLLFFFDWRLALLALIPLPVAIAMQCWIFKGFDSRIRAYHQVVADLHTSVVDFVKSMPLVKAFNMTVDSHQRYANAVEQHHRLVTGWLVDTRTPAALFKLALDLGLLCIMPVGIWLYAQGDVALATLFIFMLLGIGLMEPLYNLLQFAGMFSEMLKGVENIRDFSEQPRQCEGAVPQPIKGSDICFEDVTFRHNNAVIPTVDALSFIARQGEITAIVGPSGAGKTTAAQLIPRLYEYQQGCISIGGSDITAMPLDQLMSLVSFVFQDVFIFEDTIMNNIRMGNQDITESQIIAAAKAACVDEFVRELPQGYQTVVQQGSLSGGQAQRISIARAIAKDSPVLILDEATAYADAKNEVKIQQALSHLMKGRTVLVIAHRLNTLVNVNKIIVMDNGGKVAEGTHQQLLQGCQLYQNMWDAHQAAKSWHVAMRNQEVSHV